MTGALKGLTVIEMAGLGPAPLAGQMLADHGAQVTVIDRASGPATPADINRRGKASVALNLKRPEGLAIAKKLILKADVLIEGFRPGVMEKLGLGPDEVLAQNPALIYGRMTGWGQEGPLAQTAGHDLNYLALTGALGAMGDADRPPAPPLNLVCDYGGGTMFLLFGILAALFERGRSGQGQVVDAAMVDGVPAMMGLLHQMRASNLWSDARADNMLDGGAPFYCCYECADGKHISVGALEPQFFAELVRLAGLPTAHTADQYDKRNWAARKAEYAQVFRRKTRDEWAAIFDGSDACTAPVLDWDEAPRHAHNAARQGFAQVDGVTQAAPAPRLSRSGARAPGRPTEPGAETASVLESLGFSAEQVTALRASGVLT